MKKNLFFAFLLLCSYSAFSQSTLIAVNSTWKYLSNGSNQGTAWRATAFSDATWSTGYAELGYGDGGEATVLSYGYNTSNKYISYYFRKSFTVSNPAQYASLTLKILRDDGAVVYLNGTEVVRSNMPAGTISYTTLASAAVGTSLESTYYTYTIAPSLLVSGSNVLAVEIHQITKTSPDVSFNCSLTATVTPTIPTVTITRGPYLQSLTPSSVIVRWRTDVATDSKVGYGTTTTLGSSKTDAIITTEHIVKLTGLTAATKYFYSIGNAASILQSGTANYFKTSPVTGISAPVRIWATGDFGTGTAAQIAVRDAFANYTSTTPANLWVWMGDNAYSAGLDNEYQSNVFNMYPNQFKSIPVFPCLGNHDYANVGYQSASALGTNFPYFSIFSVPQNAEAGGIASGTPKYYSYNYANIHFIALDSYGSLNSITSTMYNWLKNDLAANIQTWTIVYFHHPAYSKGTHNSDTEIELINMRQNIIPLLESYHVDLVLNGHSHSNERSYMMKGHYGLATTFTSSMKMSTSTNTFVKAYPYNGTVYAVCGTSGQNVGGTSSGWPMACMNLSNNTNNASLIIDVNGLTLSCKYLSSLGTIADQFTITRTLSTARIATNDFNIYQSNDQLVLNLNSDEDAKFNLSFYSIDGKLMSTINDIEMSSKNQISFSKNNFNFPSGIYIAVLTSNKIQYSQKIFLSF